MTDALVEQSGFKEMEYKLRVRDVGALGRAISLIRDVKDAPGRRESERYYLWQLMVQLEALCEIIHGNRSI